jgi:catechol 2,3-dioxygenase-like lactoylglutathione lyase family enzyme
MTIKGIFHVYVPVSDLARSKKFYGETLGWDLKTDEKDVAGFAFGNGYLVLHADAATPNPGGMHVEVEADDVNAEHARLRKLGIEPNS